MDNLADLTDRIAFGLTEYDEAVVALYELRDRYGYATATGALGSAARSHEARYGHRLRFGCCAGISLIELFPETEERATTTHTDEEYVRACQEAGYDYARVSRELDDGTSPRQPRRPR